MAAMQPAASGYPERRARHLVLLAFSICTVWFIGVFPPYFNPNELSRLDLVYAVVEQGTLHIEGVLPILGNHEDKAAANGHFYSNKPPGLAFAAIPIYRALRVIFPDPRSNSSLLLVYALRLMTVSLAIIIAFWRCGERFVQYSPKGGALVLLALSFGTPLLFYSRTFFSHAWAAALLFLAWDLLRSAEESTDLRLAACRMLLGGFVAGWAFLSEYTVVPVVVFLLARAAAGRRWKAAAVFGVGAGIPIAILLVYQAVCFGNPFIPSYAREAYPAYSQLAQQRFFGFRMPSLDALWGLLLHPARGVFVFSPFLAWAVWGLVRWWRSSEQRADCLFVGASLVSVTLLLAAYPNWHGGWSLGSRYLLPIFPLAALAASRVLDTPLSRGLFLAATVFSVAAHFLLAATWAHFPISIPFPEATGSAWFLQRGWVAPHLGPASPLLDNLSVLVALTAAAVATMAAAAASRPIRPGAPLAALIGFVPLALLLARPPELDFDARVWRAVVYSKFSGQDPEREEFLRVVASARSQEEQRRALETWGAYGPDPRAAIPASPAQR